MNYQDWTPAGWKKSDLKPKTPPLRSEIIREIKLDQSNEPKPIKRYTSIHQVNLRKLRNEKNLSQKQLAQECNLPLKDIQEIENMSGVYKQTIISRINNRYKVNLNKC